MKIEEAQEHVRERLRELLDAIRKAPAVSSFSNDGKGPHRALGGVGAIQDAGEAARQALLDLESAERTRL